jgi:hypothetical protein
VTDDGKVYIVDGVLRFDTNSRSDLKYSELAETLSSHAYLPLDYNKPFKITCDALVDKVSENKHFGIMLSYKDDMNYMFFMLSQNWALLGKVTNGNLTNKWKGQMHLPKQKKANLSIEINYRNGDLEIRVDDIQAIHVYDTLIESRGFGFFAYGKTKVDFDNVEVTF